MTTVHVPDLPAPRATLCWKQDTATLARCDRRKGHSGLHTWECMAELTKLRGERALFGLPARKAGDHEGLT